MPPRLQPGFKRVPALGPYDLAGDVETVRVLKPEILFAERVPSDAEVGEQVLAPPLVIIGLVPSVAGPETREIARAHIGYGDVVVHRCIAERAHR